MPNTYDGTVLTPRYMISFTIGCGETRAIAVPGHADDLIIIVQAKDLLFTRFVFIFVFIAIAPLVLFRLLNDPCLRLLQLI